MYIYPIATKKIVTGDRLYDILAASLPAIKEGSILAITSKIVAICQGRMLLKGSAPKDDLIQKEADWYIPRQRSKRGLIITLKEGNLIASAGIDESNGNGFYILWPKNPQLVANQVRAYLVKRFALRNVGVLITDSKSTPLRRGTTGFSLAYSGFSPLTSYVGKPDIFGIPLRETKADIADALAAAAVLVMGEGGEQTPLTVITDVPFVHFQPENPSEKELAKFRIRVRDDLYAPLLSFAPWRKSRP